MPNRNEVKTFVGQRVYTRRQVLKGAGFGAMTISAGLLNACSHCQPQPQPPTKPAKVFVVGSVLKVRPKDQPTGSNDAKLLAARNEFESFQIVIQAGSNTLRNVNVALSAPLTGPGGSTIPAKNITIYREDYYNVVTPSDQEGATGLWPDALIPARDPWFDQPRNAFPINVPAEENRVAWVDVLVPQNAAPGTYSGSMKVTAADFDATVPIQLVVLNATLPSTSSLSSAFGMGFQAACLARYGAQSCPTADEGYRLNALLMRVALDNRITISGPHYQPPVSGNIPPFRQHTLPLLNGTAPTRLPGARLTSLQVDKGANLAAWRDEARNSGFAERAFVYACDEPGGNQASWDSCRQAADDARQVWPDVPILVTASIQNANQFSATGYINRLTVIVNQMDNKPNQPNAGSQRSNYNTFLGNPKNQVWLYTSCSSHGCEPNHAIERVCRTSTPSGATNDAYYDGWPGYVIDEPASEARAMGWLSFLYQTSGELYFTTTHCLPEDPWTKQYAFNGNGDGTLFYPGAPARIGGTDWIPIESMRLKLIRDGYEDYEYLKILKGSNQEPAAYDIAKTLFPNMYTTNRRDEDLQTARRKLAHLIDPTNVP
jgi:hypothetical protein